MGIFLRDGPFSGDISIVNLYPSKGTHCVCSINENYLDSYGCFPPQKVSKLIIKRNGHSLYSGYILQGLTSKKDSYCASFCLYEIYLTKVIGVHFKSIALNLYYQKIY